jgi:anti-sigma regulatory factor (Ser/Thr protein kinase)
MKRRWIIFGTALALYAALMGVARVITTRQAQRSTEAQLDNAILDYRATVAGAIDTMLGSIARQAVRELGRAEPRPMEEIGALAKRLDIDELNVVDRTGEIIASNDPHCMGVHQADNPVTAPFLALTNGTVVSVSQPFRPHAHNPAVRAKYLAVAFPGGDGYVQVGLDERHLGEMLPVILDYVFDEWMLGRTGFLLCANDDTDVLVSNPARHRDEARTLAETGFDEAAAAPYEVVGNADRGSTFKQRIYGETCDCRNYLFGGHRFVPVLPEREFYDTRTIFGSVFGVLLFLVLGAAAWGTDRILRDKDRLKAFYDAEDARRRSEMEIAKTIQTSALPGKVPPNPVFRLAASMTPARDVGGDFYDHFRYDATHIAFLVADVSGKGITAALYMMTAKDILRNKLLATRDGAAAFDSANADLCRNNPASMFLTAWGGILDTATGRLQYINAGHNPPLVRRADGTVEWLREKSGPMLAVLPGTAYKLRTATLAPGDTLFLYTDGVTEAMDPTGALFGETRLEETLRAAPTGEPESVCRMVRAAVTAFAAGAPAADDLTVLAVQPTPLPRRRTRIFPANRNGISDSSDYLDECLAAAPSSLSPLSAPLHVMLDEVVSNVVNYAGATVFEVTAEFSSTRASLTVSDNGKPYVPFAHADPDTSLPADARPIGGLGILIVKKTADAVTYRRENGHNVLCFEKVVGGKAQAETEPKA